MTNAIPHGPSAPAGALGPRLNARIAHLGRPHYFYNRAAFAARAVQHRANATYYGTGVLQYGGGPVESTAKTYLIFWGFTGASDTAADPDGVASYLIKFFTALPNSGWLNTITQYYGTYSGPKAYITNPSILLSGSYNGEYFDPTPPTSNTYTDGAVANEALKVANIVGYDANTDYIVVSPHLYTIQGFDASSYGFCAYHSSVTITGGRLLSYTTFPYMPDAGYGCGAKAVNNPGTLDGVSIVGGHEEAETITDADATTGWLDASGQEIADKCAWLDMQNTTFPNGQSFPTQPLFSNASRSCVQSYGGGSGPSPTPSPPPVTNAVKNPGFETGHLKPWTTCHSKGRMPLGFTTTDKPHRGKYDAYAGTIQGHSEPAGVTSVCQLIAIPAEGVLTFWARGIGDDFRPGVFQFARLYNTSGTIVKTLYKIDRNEKKWHEWTFDLSAYANGQYLLAFGIQGKANAGGRSIGQYVDDVTVR
ncbi:MAG TPA: hypothetical protein VFE36_00240 [Candidatus Baltobacteraceae bacterium]|nr:hypothetical protein [Candidatus Baltobacteraceae bacterium]